MITENVSFLSGASSTTTTFTGVSLFNLLNNVVGLRTASGVPQDQLRNVVIATGSDGYAQVYAWGEINPQFGGNAPAAPAGEPLTLDKPDYDAFEQLLADIQAAYSAEDLSALRGKATPEMVSYFAEELADNASRGVINRVTDVKLLQGDLSEAWREGAHEYATVAMHFALTDTTVERASGRTVEGGQPGEVTELWTFMRARGGVWLLSAIQQG